MGEIYGSGWIESRWDLDQAPIPWSRVKGPMGAAQMHLKEMSWQARWCRGTSQLRDNGDVRQPNPEYGMGMPRQMLEEARISVLWAEA
eukprot:4255023-Karenia_brevis.AAC.1